MLTLSRSLLKLRPASRVSQVIHCSSTPKEPQFHIASKYSIKPVTATLRTLYLQRQFCSNSKGDSSSSSDSSPLGSIFDLTEAQYAELKNPQTPRDFQYTTYNSPPSPLEDEPIFEPKHLDLESVTELMVRKRHVAAIKRALIVLEPHRQVIHSGFPTHDPSLNADLRFELSELLNLLSLCYLNQNINDKAIDASMSAANLVPTADNFSDLAHHLLQVGRLDEAIVAAERSISIDPYKEVDALVTKASALWQLKRLKGHDIVGLCDLALARDPYVTTALEIKAQYLAYTGKYGEAIKTIDRAIAKDNDNFYMIRLKTGFLEQIGKLPLALTVVLKYFREDPESIEAHQEAARIAILIKDWKIAIEQLKILNEKLEIGYADLAYVMTQIEEIEEAEKALQIAIRINDNTSIANKKPYSFATLKRNITNKRKKMSL
jgi:tetratricopeptide (TPR) repeat protein